MKRELAIKWLLAQTREITVICWRSNSTCQMERGSLSPGLPLPFQDPWFVMTTFWGYCLLMVMPRVPITLMLESRGVWPPVSPLFLILCSFYLLERGDSPSTLPVVPAGCTSDTCLTLIRTVLVMTNKGSLDSISGCFC